jgi:hypothetical protein
MIKAGRKTLAVVYLFYPLVFAGAHNGDTVQIPQNITHNRIFEHTGIGQEVRLSGSTRNDIERVDHRIGMVGDDNARPFEIERLPVAKSSKREVDGLVQ